MEFRMPELGEGVHEGELVQWRVKPGDTVKQDQPLADVMTDKATVEVPAQFNGVVKQLHFKEGDVVKVDQVMITFEGAGASAGATKESKPAAAPANGHAQKAPVSAPTSAAEVRIDTNPATRALAAPMTRRLAREQGVDLSRVQGSGPHGRIMKEDLARALSSGGSTSAGGMILPTSAPKSYPAGGEQRVAFRGLRKKISEKMRQSKDHAAHFTYVEEADATELVRLRNAAKEIGAQQGVKVTYLPFLMKAMVAALRQYPILNSSLDEEKQELVYKHYFNIGLSVQTEDGLMAPVVKDVEHKSILEIARDIQGIVDRARTKKLTMDELTGSTITLTNAGSIGGLFATPVINYPEVAILGFNKIFRKPVVRTVGGREKIVVRDWTYFSISLDHRVVDGAVGAEFMKLFIQYIENPNLLLLESL